MLALNDLESANARANEHAHAVGNLRRDRETRLRHRLLRRRKGKVDEAPHLAGLFLIHEIQRVKVLDFGSEGDGEAGGVEALNRGHTAGPG